MNTRPMDARAVVSRHTRLRLVIVPDGSSALASSETLTPPYSAARGPMPIVPPECAASMAMCRPTLAAATPATMGRLAAVNRATD